MEYILIGVLVVALPVIALYMYHYGKKKGADWLLSLLIQSGFQAKVKGFKKQNQYVKKGGIVFVGDSITQDYNVYEYFSSHLVYNRGIGGDTTEGLLKRMDVSIYELEPSHVVLLIGTNDFGVLNAVPQDIFKRMQDIVLSIQKTRPETKIILQSVYPVNPNLDHLSVGIRNNQTIMALNQLYQSIPGVTYLDVYADLIDDSGHLNEAYTVEGLHINQEGYALITNIIKKYLN